MVTTANSKTLSPLCGRRILLCVSGGIAAYKAAELIRRLRNVQAQVRVAITKNAAHFVTAMTFQALSGQRVHDTLWDDDSEAAMSHLALARWAQQVIIAPATANILAKMTHGIADDLISTLCLATTAPITVAPAMNHCMWQHPPTQANMAILRTRHIQVIGPDDGLLAENESGPGRMAEPEAIVSALAASPHEVEVNSHTTQEAYQPLTGRRVVISAGPTIEDIDPVRFISNRSSGKMGFAIATAAVQRGAHVVLIAGPVQLDTPSGVKRIDVRSATQMSEAVLSALPADIYIGAAAIADWSPHSQATRKLKKHQAADTFTLDLVRTDDVLLQVAKHQQRPQLVIGFAAETDNMEHNALTKLREKNLDLIAANRVDSINTGFDVEHNTLTVYGSGTVYQLGFGSKLWLANALMDIAVQKLSQNTPGTDV